MANPPGVFPGGILLPGVVLLRGSVLLPDVLYCVLPGVLYGVGVLLLSLTWWSG